jgi:hypothetical protein
MICVRPHEVDLKAGSCAGLSLTTVNAPRMWSDLRLRSRQFSSVLDRSRQCARNVPDHDGGDEHLEASDSPLSRLNT